MKCEKCGKKIQYNQYVVYHGKVCCPECHMKILTEEIAKEEKLKVEIAAKRKARKEKRKRMKKKSKKTESYNPFENTNGANE